MFVTFHDPFDGLPPPPRRSHRRPACIEPRPARLSVRERRDGAPIERRQERSRPRFHPNLVLDA